MFEKFDIYREESESNFVLLSRKYLGLANVNFIFSTDYFLPVFVVAKSRRGSLLYRDELTNSPADEGRPPR